MAQVRAQHAFVSAPLMAFFFSDGLLSFLPFKVVVPSSYFQIGATAVAHSGVLQLSVNGGDIFGVFTIVCSALLPVFFSLRVACLCLMFLTLLL